ncbi:MAG: glycosyltransferase [Terriglobia bacterium]
MAWNHGYTAISQLDRAYALLDRWSLPKAYRVVTVCRPFADDLVKVGVDRDKIMILHNSVRPFVAPPQEEVQRARRKLGIADDEGVILSIGRLSQEKGHADLIRAAAVLSELPGVPRFSPRPTPAARPRWPKQMKSKGGGSSSHPGGAWRGPRS